jgi:hypothetical protein
MSGKPIFWWDIRIYVYRMSHMSPLYVSDLKCWKFLPRISSRNGPVSLPELLFIWISYRHLSIYTISIYVFHFPTVYPCFAFKNNARTSKFPFLALLRGEPVSSVRYSVWIRAGRPGDRGLFPRRGERIFSLASVSRPALGPTQPPVQRIPGVLSPGLKRGLGVKLTTHPYLVPRSRMSRSYTSSPKRFLGV